MRKLILISMCYWAALSWGAAVSPLQRLKKDLQRQYRSEFTYDVIDGFANMEVTRSGAAQNSLKWFGKEAISYFRDFGDYAAVAEKGEAYCQTNMIRMATIFNDKWMSYWKGLPTDVHEKLLNNPDRLMSFLDTIEYLKAGDDGDRNLEFITKHPNALVYLKSYPELLDYPDTSVAAVTFALRRIELSNLSPERQIKLHNALQKTEIVVKLIEDRALSQVYGEIPLLLFLTEPRLFQVTSNPEADLIVNRNRIMLLSTHLDYFANRKIMSPDWDTEVNDLNAIFSYCPQRPDITPDDWIQMLLACQPESEKLMELLKKYLRKPDGFATVERIVSAIMSDMNCYPPSDLCVLLRLIREGSLIDDFETLVKICLSAGLKVMPDDTCQYPGVMLILSGVPSDDPEFMDYLGKKEYGMRLIAYLGDSNYGKDIAERWGRAKLLKLADIKYDESSAKQLINHIPMAGSLVNIGIKMTEGYPVSTAEYLCAAVDAAGLAFTVATMGAGAGAAEAGKSAVKEGTKIVTKEVAKKTLAVKAKVAITVAESWAKKYASKAGEYIDEHRDELKDRIQQMLKYIEETSNRANEDEIDYPQRGFDILTSDKLLSSFGRMLPLRSSLVGFYANSRGLSQELKAPTSLDKWCNDFNSTTRDILLISLCVK